MLAYPQLFLRAKKKIMKKKLANVCFFGSIKVGKKIQSQIFFEERKPVGRPNN